jgi:hypothetical protein
MLDVRRTRLQTADSKAVGMRQPTALPSSPKTAPCPRTLTTRHRRGCRAGSALGGFVARLGKLALPRRLFCGWASSHQSKMRDRRTQPLDDGGGKRRAVTPESEPTDQGGGAANSASGSMAVKSDGSQRHSAGQPRQAGRLLKLTLAGHGWYCPRSLYDSSNGWYCPRSFSYHGGGGFDGEGVGAEGVGAGVG